MKNKIIILLVMVMAVTCINTTSSAYAKDMRESEIDYKIYEMQENIPTDNVVEMYQTPANVIVTPDEATLLYRGEFDDNVKIDDTLSLFSTYESYEVTNINKVKYSSYEQLTNYAEGPGNLTYSAGNSFTVSGGMSVEGGFSYYVTLAIGFNASHSYEVSASETYSRDIPSGYKGAIVMRYSQDRVTFNQVKRYLNTIVSSTPGYVWSPPYELYYSLSLISL